MLRGETHAGATHPTLLHISQSTDTNLCPPSGLGRPGGILSSHPVTRWEQLRRPQEYLGCVSGCAAALAESVAAALQCIWGLLWMCCIWEVLPNPLFPAACFDPGWEHYKPSWFRADLRQELGWSFLRAANNLG